MLNIQQHTNFNRIYNLVYIALIVITKTRPEVQQPEKIFRMAEHGFDFAEIGGFSLDCALRLRSGQAADGTPGSARFMTMAVELTLAARRRSIAPVSLSPALLQIF